MDKSLSPITVIAVMLAIVLAGLVFASIKTVPAGHVGVITQMGAVDTSPKPEGVVFILPLIEKVNPISTQIQKVEAKSTASSKDLQDVTSKVAVQFSIKSEFASYVFQKIGKVTEVKSIVIEPAIEESLKAVTAEYTAEELITQRSKVKMKIQEVLKNNINETLQKKDLIGSVQIENMAITDFAFSVEFNRAIESKVKAEQDALKAENEKKQRITEAEAKKKEVELAAEAKLKKDTLEAEGSAILIEKQSVARALAIEREAKVLKDNPALIQLRAIEAWDGKLPVYMMGGNASPVPFIQLDTVKK